MKHQYYCPSCYYHREGLLDSPAIGIGSYSTTCPECGSAYVSKPVSEFDIWYDDMCNRYDACYDSYRDLLEECWNAARSVVAK